MAHVTGTDWGLAAVRISSGFVWPSSVLQGAGWATSVLDAEGSEPAQEAWARRLDPLSVRCVWCVGQARREAGVPAPATRPYREGVCVWTAMGAQQTRIRYASRLVTHGLAGTNPIDFPDSIDGAPAAHVASRWGLQGPSFTLVGGTHGACAALVIAARQLVLGTAERMHVVLGDIFEPRVRAALSSAGSERVLPGMRDDMVLAFVLDRCAPAAGARAQIMLVGFMGAQPPAAEPCATAGAGIAVTHFDAIGAVGGPQVLQAWLGVTAPVGSETIACQDAPRREAESRYPLANPQCPRLAFVRAGK